MDERGEKILKTRVSGRKRKGVFVKERKGSKLGGGKKTEIN